MTVRYGGIQASQRFVVFVPPFFVSNMTFFLIIEKIKYESILTVKMLEHTVALCARSKF